MTSQEPTLEILAETPQSSAISTYSYNGVEGTLNITFTSGGSYKYDVTNSQFMAFHLAESKGKALHELRAELKGNE